MKTYVQEGEVMTVVAAAAVESGEGVVVGELFGISPGKYAIGDEMEIALEGVFKVDKTFAQAYTQGQILYFDAATKKVTSTVASNKVAGYAFKASLASVDTYAVVLLPRS